MSDFNLKAFCFWTVFVLSMAFSISGFSQSPGLKVRVGIKPAVDLWVTLSDGSRVFFGQEVSFLLGHELFHSGAARPILLGTTGAKSFAPADGKERFHQINPEWLDWLTPQNRAVADSGEAPSRVDLIIEPVVDELQYTSGARSNKVVFRAVPAASSELQPFADNEFVPMSGQRLSCASPDYFGGQFNTAHGGLLASNFGADGDEGFSISFMGYGVGYKKKKYEVSARVHFKVTYVLNSQNQERGYSLVAKGKDVFIAGSYQHFSLGIEIQRRETLRAVLSKMVPQIVSDFLHDQSYPIWSTQVFESSAERVLVDTGANDGITVGTNLYSVWGSIFQVTEVYGDVSKVTKVSGGHDPIEGEMLISQPPQEYHNAIAAMAAQNAPPLQAKEIDVALSKEERAQVQNSAVTQLECYGKKESWAARLLKGLLSFLGYTRYKTVFDQPFYGGSAPRLAANQRVVSVGFLDTGVDYNDPDLAPHAALSRNLGYDFISQDNRPSDDNGHGTAAAKLFAKLTRKPWALTSIKVFTPYALTQSLALYEGFKFAANQHLDVLIVPWRPQVQSLAFEQGVALAQSAGVKVFVPPPFDADSKKKVRDFRTEGLGSTVLRLPIQGIKAVQAAADALNQEGTGK